MQRIFGLAAAALASLALGLALPAMAQKAEAPKAAAKAEPAKSDAKPDAKKEMEKPKGEPMDINSASEKELATLPGIGDARAKAIVKGRPYKGKDDLVHKKILTQKVYDGIKDQIIAKQEKKDDSGKMKK